MHAEAKKQTVPDWLGYQARTRPTQLAVEHVDGGLTYAELRDTAWNLAGRLSELGVLPMHRVGIAAAHGLTYVKALHGIMQADAIVVPINLRLAPAEIAWQLEDAGVEVVLTDTAHRALIDEAYRRARRPGHCFDVQRDWSVSVEGMSTTHSTPVRSSGLARSELNLSSTQAIVYTSGTTGLPKGVQLSYANHLAQATASAIQLGLDAQERWLAPMPLFHVGGLNVLMRSLVYGTTAVLHDKFDATAVNESLSNAGITILSVVPTMLQRMLAQSGRAPYNDRLRCVLLGGSAAPEALLRQCQQESIPVAQSYGMTETDSQVATLHPSDGLRKLGSSGKPLFPSDIRIERGGEEAAVNEVGEIVIKGPTVTKGYWQRPDATLDAIRDGWLYTGDVGRIDDEGYLYVLDRRKDLIVSGGENVYPAEVERVLVSHPAVHDAGVIGVADAMWGQVPVAFVVAQAGSSVGEEELRDYCLGQLARYKVPKQIVWRSELPRNASGKLLRRLLMQWLSESKE